MELSLLGWLIKGTAAVSQQQHYPVNSRRRGFIPLVKKYL
jgi:hypothetical protein